MNKKIEHLKADLKIYKKERFKKLRKDGVILKSFAFPLGIGEIIGGTISAFGLGNEKSAIGLGIGTAIGLSIGTLYIKSKLNYALYSDQIKLIKQQIKEEKQKQKIK
ncbi:MAG: hypothetical protein IJO43_05200 [Bacilli bacterium]|nr:hypothetical protein [Bacilli bacterium]